MATGIIQRGRPVLLGAIKSGQSRLLKVLFIRFNSTHHKVLHKELQVSSHNVTNWWRKGGIPLTRIGKISTVLHVSPYALNYVEVLNLMGQGPTWGEVIAGCKLTPTELSYVKKGTNPK